jgi:hypothetical protein
MPMMKCVGPLEAPPSANGRADKKTVFLASAAQCKQTLADTDLRRAAGDALTKKLKSHGDYKLQMTILLMNKIQES